MGANINFETKQGIATTFKNIDGITVATDTEGVNVEFNYIDEVVKYGWEVEP